MAERYGRWEGHDPDERRPERDSWRKRDRARQDFEYPGGGFESEHQGYAHAHDPQDPFGRGYSAHGGSYGAQSGGGYGTGQGAFSHDGGHGAQHATGYGSHGYGGQTSGYGHPQAGYGPQGSNAYEGGPGYGLPGDYGSNRHSAASPARRGGGFTSPGSHRRQDASGGFGGYGPEGGGYGTQSNYAAHGGYGSPGERWQSGYGDQGGHGSQGYGTHAGYGSQGGYGAQGYGPRGEAHWPQSSWAEQGHRQQRRGPKGYKRSDERIREDLCERLMHSDFIDSSEVTIDVTAGKVVIDGTVPQRGMKHAIEDMAEATSGVTEVENKVRVQQPGSSGGWAGSGAPAPAGSTAKRE